MINFVLIIRGPNDKQYEIEQKDKDSIWIGDGSGESGEFNSIKFFEAIDKFYKENF